MRWFFQKESSSGFDMLTLFGTLHLVNRVVLSSITIRMLLPTCNESILSNTILYQVIPIKNYEIPFSHLLRLMFWHTHHREPTLVGARSTLKYRVGRGILKKDTTFCLTEQC